MVCELYLNKKICSYWHFVTLWVRLTIQVYFVFLLSQPWNCFLNCFLKNHVSFQLRLYSHTKMWVQVYLLLHWCYCFQKNFLSPFLLLGLIRWMQLCFYQLMYDMGQTAINAQTSKSSALHPQNPSAWLEIILLGILNRCKMLIMLQLLLCWMSGLFEDIQLIFCDIWKRIQEQSNQLQMSLTSHLSLQGPHGKYVRVQRTKPGKSALFS